MFTTMQFSVDRGKDTESVMALSIIWKLTSEGPAALLSSSLYDRVTHQLCNTLNLDAVIAGRLQRVAADTYARLQDLLATMWAASELVRACWF